MLRNKRNHLVEMPPDVRRRLLGGDAPNLLVPLMLHPDRFPLLLMTCHALVLQFFADVDVFRSFIGANTARLHGRSAAAARQRAETEVAAALALLQSPAPPLATPAAASDAPSHRRGGTGASAGVATAAVHDGGDRNDADVVVGTPGVAVAAAVASASTSKPVTVDDVVAAAQNAVFRPATSAAWYGDDAAWLAAGAAVVARARSLLVGFTDTDAGVVGVGGDAGVTRGSLVAVGCMRETTFKGGAHVWEPRYKTAECADWKRTGGEYCPRGVRCDFAHGPVEARVTRGVGVKQQQRRR